MATSAPLPAQLSDLVLKTASAIPSRPQNSIATRKLGWYYKARWKGEKSAVGVYIRCANVVTCCVILEILWIWYSCGWARLTFNEKRGSKGERRWKYWRNFFKDILSHRRLFIISRGNRIYIYICEKLSRLWFKNRGIHFYRCQRSDKVWKSKEYGLVRAQIPVESNKKIGYSRRNFQTVQSIYGIPILWERRTRSKREK